ncbi:YciI family protein [Pantoea cypripedii]|uniref:YciI family protein n=1 Tax=Pantoea cypripedii TaxID=55209 RepID=UPI000A10E124
MPINAASIFCQQTKVSRKNDNDQPVGALWIVVAADEEEASKVFATDPFWVFGLRASVEVLSWSLAFEDMLL